MIRLAGRTVRDEQNPRGEIEVVFTGLRPGEKMFEELVIGAELGPTTHPSVMRAREGFATWDSVETELQRLEAAVAQHDRSVVRGLVSECITTGSPGRSRRV
jgi:FlaA1/EpsC-like NDP-sugar epimerase